MAKQTNYAKLTRELTGMTPKQYKKEYTKFAARVRNYNAVAGTQYQAAREFYFSFRYSHAKSPALRAIEATPATRARRKGQKFALGKKSSQVTEKAAVKVFEKKWAGWLQAGRDQAAVFGASRAEAIFDLLKSGTITYKEADEEMRALADERRTTGKNDNFIY